MKKPKLPRKISVKALNKMTGKQLKTLRDKLGRNSSSLWKWGWTERKLSSKSYVKHKVRVKMLSDNVDNAITKFWKSKRRK